MAGRPPITVLMTVCNAQLYLAQAIQSVLAQTWRDFELLTVIDDASTDSSGEMLTTYAAKDARVRILRIAGQGRIPALNRGLQEAAGDLLAILDADDVAAPDRLQRQMDFLGRHPDTGVLGGAVRYIDHTGRPGRIARMPTAHEQIVNTMVRGSCMMNSTVLARRTAMLEAGAYRDTVPAGEDYDLWLRMIDRVRFANLPEVLADYRIHPGQLTVSKLRVLGEATLIARQSLLARRRDGRDPVAHLPVFSPEVLAILGITDQQIAAMSMWIALGRARILIDTGYGDEAVAVLDEPMPAALPSSLRAELLFNRDLLRSGALRARGRYGAALGALTSAALNLPALAAIGRRLLGGKQLNP